MKYQNIREEELKNRVAHTQFWNRYERPPKEEYNCRDLLAGLTNKYNIRASTLDKADVEVMKDRIQNDVNLLENRTKKYL
jgi:hypothetical protein